MIIKKKYFYFYLVNVLKNFEKSTGIKYVLLKNKIKNIPCKEKSMRLSSD